MLSNDALLHFDRQHIWHPYASLIDGPPVYPVESAHGVTIRLRDGRQLIDGVASWWSVLHGYNHPRLNEAAKGQLDNMAHVMFGGFTHEPAVALAQKLVALTPAALDKVFFSDSGSVAVEVAIKMAIQYWYSVGKKNKHRLMTIRNGYHGDTFATMAVCDPVTGMHHLFNDVLTQQLFVEQPRPRFGEPCTDEAIAEFEQCIRDNHASLAAVILEPIVQGTGGMHFYSAEYLQRVRQLCDQYDVLLIHDEIATGFGRTGKMFACEHAGIAPDIMCVGKALTGGYITLAATLCSEKISDGICRGEAGVFMHGPTYMANPLACAIANANIELLLEEDWAANVQRIHAGLSAGLAPARDCEHVADVRTLGGIGVIEMKEPVAMASIQEQLVAHGIWLRPFGKLVYTIPPYIIQDDELQTLTAAMVDVIRHKN